MKAFLSAAVLIVIAALPCRAHHEHAYGIFWKAGGAAPKSGALPADLWRYAFVSRYSWTSAAR